MLVIRHIYNYPKMMLQISNIDVQQSQKYLRGFTVNCAIQLTAPPNAPKPKKRNNFYDKGA